MVVQQILRGDLNMSFEFDFVQTNFCFRITRRAAHSGWTQSTACWSTTPRGWPGWARPTTSPSTWTPSGRGTRVKMMMMWIVLNMTLEKIRHAQSDRFCNEEFSVLFWWFNIFVFIWVEAWWPGSLISTWTHPPVRVTKHLQITSHEPCTYDVKRENIFKYWSETF